MRGRFPASVYECGTEPDPRFSLANERTFLAGIRTSLALLAVAVALLALDLPIVADLKLASACLFGAGSATSSAWAWVSWARTERDLRMGQPLAAPGAGAGMVGVLVLGVVFLAVGLVLGDDA